MELQNYTYKLNITMQELIMKSSTAITEKKLHISKIRSSAQLQSVRWDRITPA